ncbi:TetR/AcrR family transcriptional regulator [Actinomadura kijaniata]|uniref:TetR/AcrR family transcriptional regulator n=1 Tax=Actinomadura kijaniata TaxID=46161 RepID=UPI00083240E3|nr:TetR/AcrR family transcriptional regulator [Actinomadura kijaniata]
MPARGDHDARRRDVSEAVWRVLAARGFDGLTLRAVAAEMNASTGLLTHYFPTKKALVRHALDLAGERTGTRSRPAPPAPGLPALRTALLDVLPRTAQAVELNRVWVSSWDAALGDPDLGDRERDRYERWRGELRAHLEKAVELGELPPDADVEDLAASAAAFTHGLVVQVLFDPDRFPPERQAVLLDAFLDSLAHRPGRPAGSPDTE